MMDHNSRHFYLRLFAITCLVVGLAIIGVTLYRTTLNIASQTSFDDGPLLQRMWQDYKAEYWESSTGRTLDKQQNDITTSEGQSYTMLRAVWSDDRATFDTAWNWTQQQLQHTSGDKLFAWRWGKTSSGSYGVLTEQGGQNSAADADSDIALALLMASSRWQQPSYKAQAAEIITSIWQQEVMDINGHYYLLGNNLEKQSAGDTVIVNPSYYAPYAFRLFAHVDSGHDWQKLVGDSYQLLNEVTDSPLNTSFSAELPPDWVVVNKTSGTVSAAPSPNLTTNFSYDANRTVWRLAMDYQWNNDGRAKALLTKFGRLASSFTRDDKLYSTYSHDGNVLIRDEVPAMYGATFGYFLIVRPDMAQTIYARKLKATYDTAQGSKTNTVSYYSDNWAWFGMALANKSLPNLYKQ